MKIKVGKYTWNSKKCVPLQFIKDGLKGILIAAGVYCMYIACYYILVPFSTMG